VAAHLGSGEGGWIASSRDLRFPFGFIGTEG
jgi:hypothetical protein